MEASHWMCIAALIQFMSHFLRKSPYKASCRFLTRLVSQSISASAVQRCSNVRENRHVHTSCKTDYTCLTCLDLHIWRNMMVCIAGLNLPLYSPPNVNRSVIQDIWTLKATECFSKMGDNQTEVWLEPIPFKHVLQCGHLVWLEFVHAECGQKHPQMWGVRECWIQD